MNQSAPQRQIIHVDMDAFYASVEQRDNPELQGKPVVVGGNPDSRGVASTCSYEARKYGIRSAMPLAQARRLCPQTIFLPVDISKYSRVSRQIHSIFAEYTPLIEPISLDEAFLDVTASRKLFGSAEQIARKIKDRIKQELQLTASVGIAPNKFLAKLASDLRKPDGFVVVKGEDLESFLNPLPVEKIWGVGPKTAEELHKLHIKTVRDLQQWDEASLQKRFGLAGSQLYYLARGIDDRPVEPDREVKSIGRETTFAEDLMDQEVLKTIILDLSTDVGIRLRKGSFKAKTITLKVRFADFTTLTRSKTLDTYTDFDSDIFREASLLLEELHVSRPVRLIGVTVHNLTGEEIQPSLFDTEHEEMEKLTKTIDAIKERFGDDSITLARLLKTEAKNQNMQIKISNIKINNKNMKRQNQLRKGSENQT